MSRFVSTEVVPVHTPEDPDNVIYIKPRMDVGTAGLVRSAMVIIQTQASISNGATPSDATLRFDIAAYNIALLAHNVVSWRGPDFDGTPCNVENIKRLDPDDPLLALVLQQIGERNLSKVASPNSSSAPGKNGSTPSTEPQKQAVARKGTSA